MHNFGDSTVGACNIRAPGMMPTDYHQVWYKVDLNKRVCFVAAQKYINVT